MTTISAAVEDLEELARRCGEIDEEIRATILPLDTALQLVWRSSGARLAGATDVVVDLRGHLRAAAEVADAAVGGARRLAAAGSDGNFLVGSGGAPRGLLRGGLALETMGAARAGLGLVARIARAFRSPSAAPYVTRTVRRVHEAAVMGHGVRYEMLREEMSDGSVRLSVVDETSASYGVGIGAACHLAVDGFTVYSGSGLASAEVALSRASGRTWSFPSAEAADRWWGDHHRQIEGEIALKLLAPGGDLAVGTARRLGFGTGDDLDPDERFDEVAGGGHAAAQAGLRFLGGGAAAQVSAEGGGTVRVNDDDSVTVTVTTEATASAQHDVNGPFAGYVGAQLGAMVSVALTTSPGGDLTRISLRTVEVDGAGQRPSLEGATRPGSVVAGEEEPHVYETTLDLDLTDPATRAAVETTMGLDLDRPGDQVLAALGSVTLDPRTILAGRITVVERTLPEDQTWAVGCDLDLPVAKGSASATTGQSSAETVAVWDKATGATDFTPRT